LNHGQRATIFELREGIWWLNGFVLIAASVSRSPI